MKIIEKFLKNKLAGFVVTAVATFAFLGLNSFDNVISNFVSQNNFIYSGTYGLFVGIQDGMEFNWFTDENEKGFYEILGDDGEIIAKGETSASKVHKYNLSTKLKSDILFRFGGTNETIHEVRLSPVPNRGKSIYNDIDSIYVVGDVHGRYDQLINLLKKSNIIDSSLNWIAGESHLVFLGDLFDRGNDVTKVLWFIYGLEKKAEISGGKVHLVIGNHEIMTMINDLRYVSPKENAIAGAFKKTYDELFHPTKSFLGAWVRSKPSILKINDVIFAHGGILDLGGLTIDDFNKKAYDKMKENVFLDIMKDSANLNEYNQEYWEDIRYFFYGSETPYWYRGYVNSDTLTIQLNTMLRTYRSKIHVVAHTPLKTITQRYKGKLLTTDLEDAATQLLLLVKEKKKYKKYKISSSGVQMEL